MKFLFPLFFLCFALLAQAESSCREAAYEGKKEKEITQETNLVRTNPQSYAAILEDQLKTRVKKMQGSWVMKSDLGQWFVTQEGPTAIQEAIVFLKQQKPLPPFTESNLLEKSACDHVLDSGRSGHMGHDGVDGSHFFERIQRYTNFLGTAGENIAYIDASARDIVLGLIIDDGVSSRGHRHAIFSTEFAFVGIACGPHATYGLMCVQDFAQELAP